MTKYTLKQTFEIRCELPDFNTIVNTSKTHWSKYSSPKKGYDAIVSAYARQKLKPVENYPVDIHCHWVVPNRRKDPDGISAGAKFILDGLVKAGILRNDGFSEVCKITHEFSVDRRNPKIIVTILEVDHE